MIGRFLIVALFVIGARASAQRAVPSIEASGIGVWYADTIRSAGVSVTPAIRFDWRNATINASGTASRLGQGATSLQGAIAPSVFSPSYKSLSLEGAAAIGGSSHHDGTRTGQALGVGRLHLIRDDVGGWLGGGVGRTSDGATWRNVRQAEIGAWTSRRNVDALATVTPVEVDSVRYTDWQAALRVARSRFDLGVTGGARSGSVGEAVGGSSRAWGSVTATTWLSMNLALVVSGGTYPVDLTQGYPGGRFVTFALRLGRRDVPNETSAAESTASASAFELRPASQAGRRTIRFNAPNARLVEISGDFTKWQTVRLTRDASGWWSAVVAVTPGTHQMNIRVDGGPWIAPPGLLTSRDEFGGVVGILVVE